MKELSLYFLSIMSSCSNSKPTNLNSLAVIYSRHQFLSVFASCSDLTSKLFLGHTNFIVSSFHEYQVSVKSIYNHVEIILNDLNLFFV